MDLPCCHLLPFRLYEPPKVGQCARACDRWFRPWWSAHSAIASPPASRPSRRESLAPPSVATREEAYEKDWDKAEFGHINLSTHGFQVGPDAIQSFTVLVCRLLELLERTKNPVIDTI